MTRFYEWGKNVKSKIKIIAIFLCILMLLTTTIAVGQTAEDQETEQIPYLLAIRDPEDEGGEEDEDDEDESDGILGWCYVRGWLMNKKIHGSTVEARAIRLSYIEFTPTGRSWGVVRLKKITFKERINFGRFYDFGPLGSLTYVTGFFHGGIEID